MTLLPPWIDDIEADKDAERATIQLPPEPPTLAAFRSWVLSDAAPEKLPVRSSLPQSSAYQPIKSATAIAL